MSGEDGDEDDDEAEAEDNGDVLERPPRFERWRNDDQTTETDSASEQQQRSRAVM